MIGNIIDGALACFFDKSGLPSVELLEEIHSKFPQELEPFIKGWVYCITVGRGAPIVSRYMDAISNGYIKQLTQKQKKSLKISDEMNINRIHTTINDGLNEIIKQYTRILRHLRAHHEILIESENLKPLSKSLRNYLNEWQKRFLKSNKSMNLPNDELKMSLNEIKQKYDEILKASTCRCLLGLSLEINEIKKVKITPFEKFAMYLEECICLCGNCHAMITSKYFEENSAEILSTEYYLEIDCKKVKFNLNGENFSNEINNMYEKLRSNCEKAHHKIKQLKESKEIIIQPIF